MLFRLKVESLLCWKRARHARTEKRRQKCLADAHFAESRRHQVVVAWRRAVQDAEERRGQSEQLHTQNAFKGLLSCIRCWQQNAREYTQVHSLTTAPSCEPFSLSCFLLNATNSGDLFLHISACCPSPSEYLFHKACTYLSCCISYIE
jgi:hypothetical protein